MFVNTNPKKERISVLKDNIKDLDDDDPNVFLKNLLDRYQHRPQEVQAMCLAEFAATFATDYKPKDDDESQSDVLPTTSSSEAKSSLIALTDGFGKMNRCEREAVIRFRKYKKEAEPVTSIGRTSL